MKLKNMILPTLAVAGLGASLGVSLAFLLNKDESKSEQSNIVFTEDKKTEEKILYSEMIAQSEMPYTIMNFKN